MNKRWISTVACVLLANLGFPCFALTPQQVQTAYKACVAFLKTTPELQKTVAARTGYTLSETLWGCQTMVSNGLAADEYDEGVYQENKHISSSPISSNETASTPSSGFSLEPCTCYYMMDCNGQSYHSDNGPEFCPAGYDSYEYDMGGDGCQSLH